MANSSTVGEHIESWCPYRGFSLEAAATQTGQLETQEAGATYPDVLEELNDMPCAFVQNGICVLAAYSVKNTLGSPIPDVTIPTKLNT
jgi:hypothetical protein